MKAVTFAAITIAGLLWLASSAPSLEKVKFASAVRRAPVYYLPITALYPKDDFSLWVLTGSRFKKPKDMAGAKIGVSRLRGTSHFYGRIIAKSVGSEKDVKYISVGGVAAAVAALRSGAVDMVVEPAHVLMNLKHKGTVKELARVDDHHPQEWTSRVIFAHRDLVKSNPMVVKKAVRAVLQAVEFLRTDKSWGINKMKKMQRYSDEVARLAFQGLRFTKDGKISKKGLENVRRVLIDYGMIKKEKAPPVEKMYTPEFTQ
jgi:ABC-type nitrate/sulfonate/bicarbonate transport system substrate-binding protein